MGETVVDTVVDTMPGGYRRCRTARPADRPGYVLVREEVAVPHGCDGPGGLDGYDCRQTRTYQSAYGPVYDLAYTRESEWLAVEWERLATESERAVRERRRRQEEARRREWDAAGDRLAAQDREAADLQPLADAICARHGLGADAARVYYPRGSGYPSLAGLAGYAIPRATQDAIRAEWDGVVSARRTGV
jgi:hypothetical protein